MELVGRKSVTPEDAGCQDLILERLQPLGFRAEPLRFGDVSNLWARRGSEPPLFVFAGHTDVVPPGPLSQWHTDPFTPTLREGMLHGRGAADMKGSLAAMVTAAERFVDSHPKCRGSIGFLLTSDEEGPTNENGTVRVVEQLSARGEIIDWCVVGEPTSEQRLGDVIKNGRRGSLTGTLTVQGVQGHVAYPRLAVNPIHRLAPALAKMCGVIWDEGNAHFPPTTLQFTRLESGTGADNVIPPLVTARFNFRYSTASTEESLRSAVEAILEGHGLARSSPGAEPPTYALQWNLSGRPYLTPEGRLVGAVRRAIAETNGAEGRLSTGGGTSDGRFIAPTGAQVVELGPLNSTIHKANECVAAADLDTLALMYERVLSELLG